MMPYATVRPTISVIIPVHNGGENFRRCLKSLAALDPAPREVIVVADGETDGSWRRAEDYGFKALRLPVSGGPARARNRGAQRAWGDILLFADADVTLPEDAVGSVASFFENNTDFAAVIGSYDHDPFEPNFLSQYKNLLHHYVHQNSKTEASTFWSGCGAIRREIFLDMGGFDETYRRPSVEDIELGYRLKKAGHRIRLSKTLQVKHLKKWGAISLLRVDIFFRALPWTRMIMNGHHLIDDLNLTLSSRVSVILVYVTLFTLLGAFLIPGLAVPTGLFMLALFILNSDFYRFLKDRRGLRFAATAIPWHWLYFFYSGLVFSFGFAEYHVKRMLKRERREGDTANRDR